MNVSELAKQNNVEPNKAALYKVGAFFIFPLALALGAVSASILNILAVAVLLVAWILLLKVVYRRVGLSEPSKVIGVTVGTGAAFFVGEFIGGAALVLYGSGGTSSSGGGGTGVIIYLLLAVASPFLLVPLMRKATRPLLAQAQHGTATETSSAMAYPQTQTPHTGDDEPSDSSVKPE